MKHIRRLAILLVFIIAVTALVPTLALAEESSQEVQTTPDLNSTNAVVAYCIDDDQFLFSNRLDERVAPTVAAKLVACMVASDILKERSLNSEEIFVTVTNTAIDNSGDIADVRVPMMGLKVGNMYTAKDLLSATLVACANDAVAAIACHFGEKYLGGGITEFVDRMNKKVEQLGLEGTRFENPTGLDSPNQYTTPREVALIAAAFYKYDELVKLSDVESFFFNKSSTVRNKNYLKSNYYVNGYLNKSAIGLIAGQLDKRGNYCLITASEKEGRSYIFVVMCASGMIVTRDAEDRVSYSFGEGNAYEDMNKLIKWTRESFTLLTVATTDTIVGELRVNAGSSSYVMVVPGENVEKLVINVEGVSIDKKLVFDEEIVYKKDFNGVEYDTVDAPITAGQRVGKIIYSYNGAELASVDAVAKENVDSDGLKSVLEVIKNILFGRVMKIILFVILGCVGLWIVVSIVLAVVRAVNRIKNGNKSNEKKTQKTKKTNNKKKDGKTDTRDFG